MRQLIILFLGIIFSISSCTKVINIDHEALFNKSSIELEGERFVLIIPQRGCSTCVSKAYNFIFDHYSNVNCKFLFTHYSSRKAIRIRLKVFGLEQSSKIGFVDLEVARESGLSLLYPTLIELLPDGTSRSIILNAEDSSDWQALISKIQ